MDIDLKPRLRKLYVKIVDELKKVNLHAVARSMYRDECLNDTELRSIMDMSDSAMAAQQLLDLAGARRNKGIQGLASALRENGLTELANELHPPDASRQIQPKGDDNFSMRGKHQPGSLLASQSLTPASSCQPGYAAPTTAQIFSSEGKPLFVAVHLRMCKRRTYMEVQVLVDRDEPALLAWQQAWRKEEPNHPDLPPTLVTLAGFNVDHPVAVRLTSTADGGATLYNHGFRETKPSRQPDRCRTLNPRAWLFQLAEKPRFDTRQFSLHLHKAILAPGENKWCDEICEALTIPDYQGSCVLNQLGFTLDNQPVQQETTGGNKFARHATPGTVIAARALPYMISYYQAVMDRAQSVGRIDGPEISGTGFCIGNSQQKYVITCRHVIEQHIQDLHCGLFKIVFNNVDSERTTSFVLKECVADNSTLDYAILRLDDPVKSPKPISCSSSNDEKLFPGRPLTIIGYCNDFYIDTEVRCDAFVPSVVQGVKEQIYSNWPQYSIYLEDYNEMSSLADNLLFYHAAYHFKGSSGSPVFLCKPDYSIKLIALHRIGFPKFYYCNTSLAQNVIPREFAIEAGTPLSTISHDLFTKHYDVWRAIFDR